MKALSLLFFVLSVHFVQAQMPYSQAHMQRNIVSNRFDQPKDSTELTDAQRATYLALIPGAGQIYNKKYVKAGIVYAGFAGLIFFNKLSSDSLRKFETIYVNKIDENPATVDEYPLLSTSAAKNFRDDYRRNRDISILGFIGLYAIQIVDANVDAHLKEFKLNDELSLKVAPKFSPSSALSGSYTGLSIKLKF